jgi:hypothetical protein
VPLPEIILVKYTEEEADYVSMRPLVRQNFRAAELVDMIVRVAGKDLSRLQQIIRSGTVVFQSYRYWWQGFEADPAALGEVLTMYPDADPRQPFRVEACTEVMLEAVGPSKRHPVSIRRQEGSRKTFWQRQSFWDALMAVAQSGRPQYREYSYALRGDIYIVALSADQATELVRDAAKLGSRTIKAQVGALPQIRQIVYVCPRNNLR